LTNTDADPAVQSEPRDAIFAHAGHAIVTGSGNNATAMSSLFAGSSATQTTLTDLAGDPQANTLQGPVRICSSSCRDVTLKTYPYNTQMQKFNLALFMSCNSGHDGVNGYQSLSTVAFNTGQVGTSIGFYNEVSWITNAPGDNLAGDAFARKLWSDLQAGKTYATALVDAANAGGGSTYGWNSYRESHASNAPNTITPPQTYVP
jgi:hypothetical protein